MSTLTPPAGPPSIINLSLARNLLGDRRGHARRPPRLFAATAAFLILLAIVSQLALAQSPSTSFPTLSITCTSSSDCTPRHPSLFCHPTLGTCAARTCGVSQGLACSLFNSTTYCTSLTRDGTCSPRLARGKACNPALDVAAGVHVMPNIGGLVPKDEWVAQANAQCELGAYCHQHFRFCAGPDVDPNETPESQVRSAQQSTSAASTGMLGSLGNVLAVLAMAVFVCGCCALSCGRMCGWHPGHKGGMRWGRMCCGLPGALARCVGWMCGRKRKPNEGANHNHGVGKAEAVVQQQPGSVSIDNVPMQHQPAPRPQVPAAAPASLSASASSLQSVHQYDHGKQQVAALQSQSASPAFPPGTAAAHGPQFFDPSKQSAQLHHHQHAHAHVPPPRVQYHHMHAPSASSSSSSSHTHQVNPYAAPIHQFDPNKQTSASTPPVSGGYVVATAAPLPNTAMYASPPGIPASTAQMQLGKHELGMALGHTTGYLAPAAPTQGHQVYAAAAGSGAHHQHRQLPQPPQQVYFQVGAAPPMHGPPKSG